MLSAMGRSFPRLTGRCRVRPKLNIHGGRPYDGGPEMAPKPPTLEPPRPSRDGSRQPACIGAPKWPPSPQRSNRPGQAVTVLDNPRVKGPRNGPQSPNPQTAPA